MYQKTLQDVVKGIRANKKDPSAFISVIISEIKTELKSPDPRVKAQAVSGHKWTYTRLHAYIYTYIHTHAARNIAFLPFN